MESEICIRKLAVLAYGSLLAHPGKWLGKNMVKLIRDVIHLSGSSMLAGPTKRAEERLPWLNGEKADLSRVA